MPAARDTGSKAGDWTRFLLAAACAAIVAYFTALGEVNREIAKTNGRVDVAVTKEQSHFEEVQRSLVRIERFMERIEATGSDRLTGEPYSVQRQTERGR